MVSEPQAVGLEVMLRLGGALPTSGMPPGAYRQLSAGDGVQDDTRDLKSFPERTRPSVHTSLTGHAAWPLPAPRAREPGTEED